MMRSTICALALLWAMPTAAQETVPIPLEPMRGGLSGGFTDEEISGDQNRRYALALEQGDRVHVQVLPGMQSSFEVLPPDGGEPIKPSTTMMPSVQFTAAGDGTYIVRTFVADPAWRANGNRVRYQIGVSVRGRR